MTQKYLLRGKTVRFFPKEERIEVYSDFGFKGIDTSNINSFGSRILEDFVKGANRSDLLIINNKNVFDQELKYVLDACMEKYEIESQEVNAASIYRDNLYINTQLIGGCLYDNVVQELERRLKR